MAKYWQEWDDPRFVVLILHNNDLNQVTWEMRAMGGFPKFEQTQVLPSIDYAGYARLLGLDGVRVEAPDDIGPAWDRALAADRPTLIDALCDPEVPPIPPHATPEQITQATPRRSSRATPMRGTWSRPAPSRRCRSSCPDASEVTPVVEGGRR